jgi:hypothetical protein
MPRSVWWVLYLVCMALVVWGMYSARRAAIESYGSSTAKSAWDTWRERAKADSDAEGPVIRKERTSAEPPALVLMRDHFAVCVGFAMLLSSILFVTLAVMFDGAMARAPKPRNS